MSRVTAAIRSALGHSALVSRTTTMHSTSSQTCALTLPSCLRSASAATTPPLSQVRLHSHRASITRVQRATYPKPYKTLLCLQDGSTITIRTPEPSKIMVLSDDLRTMSAEDKETRFRKRKRVDDSIVVEDFDDEFDLEDYVK